MGRSTIGAALAGFFLVQLGLPQIGGNLSTQTTVIMSAMAGALFGALRLERVVVIADLFLAAIVLAIANTSLMHRVAASWVRSDSITTSVDAVVVLSADVNSEGRINDQAVERLLTGIALVRRGVAPRVFTTVVDHAFGANVRKSVAVQGELAAFGVVDTSCISVGPVRNTRDEALQTRARLADDSDTVIVVTSPMHTRRACAVFEAVGLHVVCVPAEERGDVTWRPVTSDDRLASFRQYLYERLGMIQYAAKGWLPAAQ
jgi:uncharacterized SAM-binding protein YcdF (DUF218 family)